MKFTWCRICHG